MIKQLPLTIYPPEYYDKILLDLKSLDLSQMNPTEIYKKIVEKFQGFQITVRIIKPKESISVFRITSFKPKDDQIHLPKTFSYNPNPTKIGRANLPGEHVFYGSLHPFTCLKEMKDDLNGTYYLSEWKYTPKKQLNVGLLIANVDLAKTTISSYIAEGFMSQIKQAFKGVKGDYMWHSIKIFSELFSEPNKKYYPLTASVSSHWLYEYQKKGVDIGMLMYPSVAANNEEINLAIRKDIADSNEFTLQSVTKFKLKENEFMGDYTKILERGFANEENFIKWKKPTFTLINVNYKKISLSTFCGTQLTSDGMKTAKFNIGKPNTFRYIQDCSETIEKYISNSLQNQYSTGIKEHMHTTNNSSFLNFTVVLEFEDVFVQNKAEKHKVQFISFEIEAKCKFV